MLDLNNCQTVVGATGKIDHIWCDNPMYLLVGWLRLVLTIHMGDITVCLQWGKEEMEAVMESLEENDPPTTDGLNKVWWDGWVDEGLEPPVVFYRDSAFSATLPHWVGKAMIEILKQRLNELADH